MNPALIWSIAAVCVALGALAASLAALRAARLAQARCASLEASITGLQREMELVASISVRTGRRVQRVEHEFSDVAERVDVVESRAPALAGTGAFEQAIEWARQGVDPDKLAAQFGLSRGEAELLSRLHGGKMRS